jgi:hypothetical protein
MSATCARVPGALSTNSQNQENRRRIEGEQEESRGRACLESELAHLALPQAGRHAFQLGSLVVAVQVAMVKANVETVFSFDMLKG